VGASGGAKLRSVEDRVHTPVRRKREAVRGCTNRGLHKEWSGPLLCQLAGTLPKRQVLCAQQHIVAGLPLGGAPALVSALLHGYSGLLQKSLHL
jgi:hypothetical protein